DRWNVIAGPWLYAAAYDDPWYTRSMTAGLRAGLYRTEHFAGGVYAAYRTDFRDIVAGADALWDHWPLPHTQVGLNLEQRLATYSTADRDATRAVLFGRYVMQYGPSLYLPPTQYVEAFANYQDNFLPFERHALFSQDDGPPTVIGERPQRTA